MSSQIIHTGYFGKVPNHGDFVSQGLPKSFLQPWDTWLQQAIVSSRQDLGEKEWLRYYLTSPIYRFVLSPGICGNDSWSGVLMPSVDQVGRYYPMTLCTKNVNKTNPFYLLQENQEWFSNLEDHALGCLEDDFNLDKLSQMLNDASIPPNINLTENDTVVEQTAFENTSHAYFHPLNSLDSLNSILPNFVDLILKEHCFAYSVWWTKGSEHVLPTLLICEGLPPFCGIPAMFDGDWKKWGWGDNNNYSFPYDQIARQ